MNKTSLDEFFGFAFIVDLRNFSEVCRRLLIAKSPESAPVNELKRTIYSAFFDFIVTTLEKATKNNKNLIFEYEHTGDGVLFITHASQNVPYLSSFRFLLELHSIFDKETPKLNSRLRRILGNKDNQDAVKASPHLKYIKSLFKDPSTGGSRDYITFSIGGHSGMIYAQKFDKKTLLLGNTINMAARFQELSKIFSEFNLFFSKGIKNMLEKYPNETSVAMQEILDLRIMDIRGIGATEICTIPKPKIPKVLQSLADR